VDQLDNFVEDARVSFWLHAVAQVEDVSGVLRAIFELVVGQNQQRAFTCRFEPGEHERWI